MMARVWRFTTAAATAALLLMPGSGWSQKAGGVLKIQHMDTPPSASIAAATSRAGLPWRPRRFDPIAMA